NEEQVFLGREIAQHRDYSEETAKKIDAEIKNLVMRSYERARSVLTEHVDVLHKLAERLIEKETVLGAELDELIREVRPNIELPKKPADEEPPTDNAAPEEPGSPESSTQETPAGEAKRSPGGTPPEGQAGQDSEPR
ncbi:MAG: cell division protein FtsH, partial [Desulfosarcina sp.]